ncbi:putative RNA-directed DNA polymerase [Tanacetum coccineum]
MMRLKYTDGSPVTDHLNVFQGIINQLAGMGIKFEDEIQGLWLLGTLPDTWETFRTSLSNSAPDGVTLELGRSKSRGPSNRGKQTRRAFKSRPSFRTENILDLFHALVERQTGKKLKCIRSDNGGEYIGPFDAYCREHGIQHQKTPPGLERAKMFIPSFTSLLDVRHMLYDPVQKKLVRSRDVEFDEDQTLKDVEKTFGVVIQMYEEQNDEERGADDVSRRSSSFKRYSAYEYVFGMMGVSPECYADAMEMNSRKNCFDEIFSPVVKMGSIRVVLGLAASLDLEVEQMGCQIAFFMVLLDKEIYMEQPEGFQVKGKEDYVCRLQKSLYGLKQALRQWYKKFESVIGKQGFRKTFSDHCVFFQRFGDDDFIILLLYVDDMLIVGKNIGRIAQLKQDLSKSFAMKDLGPAKQILGIRIFRDRGAKKLHISQEQYIEKVLRRRIFALAVGVVSRSVKSW